MDNFFGAEGAGSFLSGLKEAPAVRAFILALLLSTVAGMAVAQSSPPKPPDPEVLSGDKLAPEHLFGDWSGVRSTLGDHGVDFDLSYESETVSLVDGGRRSGTDYAHSVNLKTDIDAAKAFGLQGFSLHGAVVERAGRNASADLLGEHLTQVQEIYGSGGDVAVHLAYFYGEQKLFGQALDLEAGRLDVGQDFAASPLYCEFMTLSVCPSPRDLSLSTGFTIFPSSTWGGRLKGQLGKDLSVQVGVYEVRPLFGGRSGFDWSTTRDTGILYPAELDWTPQFGARHLIGHYKIGGAYDSSVYPDLWEGVTDSAAREHRGRGAFYILADQMLKRTGPNGTDGVIVLGGYSRSDPHTSALSDLGFLGVLASGVIPGRGDDTLGLQVVRLKVSGQLTASQEMAAALGAALPSGLTMYPVAPGVQSRETVLETRYDVRLATGLHMMPDVQYVIHPDAATRYSNAFVLGFRVLLDL